MKILQMRLAPLPVLLALVLLVPVVVQGQIVVQGQPAPTTQNSRAATIAAEQADKGEGPSAVYAERLRTQTRVAANASSSSSRAASIRTSPASTPAAALRSAPDTGSSTAIGPTPT